LEEKKSVDTGSSTDSEIKLAPTLEDVAANVHIKE